MTLLHENIRQPRAIAICPLCQSVDCQSNRIGNLSFGEAVGNVWTAQRAGRLAPGLRALGAWASVELANALRDRWECAFCHFTFR